MDDQLGRCTARDRSRRIVRSLRSEDAASAAGCITQHCPGPARNGIMDSQAGRAAGRERMRRCVGMTLLIGPCLGSFDHCLALSRALCFCGDDTQGCGVPCPGLCTCGAVELRAQRRCVRSESAEIGANLRISTRDGGWVRSRWFRTWVARDAGLWRAWVWGGRLQACPTMGSVAGKISFLCCLGVLVVKECFRDAGFQRGRRHAEA